MVKSSHAIRTATSAVQHFQSSKKEGLIFLLLLLTQLAVVVPARSPTKGSALPDLLFEVRQLLTSNALAEQQTLAICRIVLVAVSPNAKCGTACCLRCEQKFRASMQT